MHLVFFTRYSYDQNDSTFDQSIKDSQIGLVAGYALLGAGFLFRAVTYTFMRDTGVMQMSPSELINATLLVVISVSSWYGFMLTMMDYNEDNHDYKDNNTKQVFLELFLDMSFYVAIAITYFAGSYTELNANEAAKPGIFTKVLMVASISAVAAIVFQIVSLHVTYTSIISGGSYTFDGEKTLEKVLSIAVTVTSGVAFLGYVTEFGFLLYRGMVPKVDTGIIFHSYKVILLCAGLVYIFMGHMYSLHDLFGTQSDFVNMTVPMQGMGLQTFAFAIVLLAINFNDKSKYKIMNKANESTSSASAGYF